MIDFEFVLPSAETPAAVPQGDNHLHDTPISFDKTMVLNKSPLAGISLELDSGLTDRENAEDGAENPAWQEMATKLDLAAAYRDIGDKDGARELLDEVIKGGSNVQVQKAMALRDSLG